MVDVMCVPTFYVCVRCVHHSLLGACVLYKCKIRLLVCICACIFFSSRVRAQMEPSNQVRDDIRAGSTLNNVLARAKVQAL